jgi:polyhydroxybutyrate depolymerase
MAGETTSPHRLRRRTVALVVAAVVVIGAVSVGIAVRVGASASSSAPIASASPTDSPGASASVAQPGESATPLPTAAGTLAPGDHDLAVTVDGRKRTFILHVPTSTPASPALVLVFHGALDSAANTAKSTDFASVADARGMLIAFMQGYEDTWNEGAGHTPAEVAGVDDVAFTTAALQEIASLEPYDRSRVAAVGFSNGALLTDLLGCRIAGSLSLIVPVAGPLPVSVSRGCSPARAVSVLEIHGTADASIPYGGGPFAGVGGGTTVLSAPKAVARWAALDDCTSGANTAGEHDGVRITSYSGCRDGAKVALHAVVGAGHGWPPDVGMTVADALGVAP